jgi:hypothetical protein
VLQLFRDFSARFRKQSAFDIKKSIKIFLQLIKEQPIVTGFVIKNSVANSIQDFPARFQKNSRLLPKK